MLKDTIEVYRVEDIEQGQRSLYVPSKVEVMDAIVAWSEGKRVSVYHHHVHKRFEVQTDRQWKTPPPHPVMGDIVWYVDVYHQEVPRP